MINTRDELEEEIEPSSVRPTVAIGATAAPVRQRSRVLETVGKVLCI